MVDKSYWTTGITTTYDSNNTWFVRLDFFDEGFCDEKSSEGTLRMRYSSNRLTLLIDRLIEDAKKLGIEFRDPAIYIEGDGEWEDEIYPNNWKTVLKKQCKRIGWRFPYKA